MNRTKAFHALGNRCGSMLDAMVAVNAMTDENDRPEVYIEDRAEPRYKKVSASYAKIGPYGVGKALFIQMMTGLVLVGDPLNLRVEWKIPEVFTHDEENESIGTELYVIGAPKFLEDWDNSIQTHQDIVPALQRLGVTDKGLSKIDALGLPDSQSHEFGSPLYTWAVRGLFVSLALELYDRGGPSEVELHWKQAPKVEHSSAHRAFVATARTVVVPKQRIVVAA